MFKQYCDHCITRDHCFENGSCLRGQFIDYFDDNITEVSDLTEEEILDTNIAIGDYRKAIEQLKNGDVSGNRGE